MIIAVCDDDGLFRKKVIKLIYGNFSTGAKKDVEIIEFDTGDELDKYTGWIDIAIVDVEMGVKSGIHASRSLRKINSQVIIIVISAYDFYLDEALKYNVFRYLSKPLSNERFNRNFHDALYQYYLRTNKTVIETKQENLTVDSCNIIMVESRGGKIYVYTTGGILESVKKISYWSTLLSDNPSFYQSHKSYIINFSHVIKFTRNLIYLDENNIAYLTARKYADFKHKYFMYLDCS